MASTRHDRSHRTDGAYLLNPADAGRPRWLSIVVPAKNEATGLPQLVDEIVGAFRPLVNRSSNIDNRLDGFDIVIIDDGSTDDTKGVFSALMAIYPELRPLSLVRNVGQSAAIAAGFEQARGEWVGILDADLQNPPSELARLWDALPGYDAALGWRMKRRDVGWKRLISRLANAVRNAVLGQSIKDTGCSVRILRREVARRLPIFNGVHRFFGPLLLREGCSIIQVPVDHRPRPHGSSHYHFWNRSIKVVVDLLGVAWLMRRPARYEIVSFDTTVAPTGAIPAAHVGSWGSLASTEA
jgi:glycosyltransferase involved in cell wall biosynthesis